MFRIALLAAAIALPSLTYAQSADEPPIYERRLFDGFEGTDFAPEGGLYYRENFEQSAGRYEFQSAVKRTGNGGLKLSIVPNCPADHDGCSERAEIWERPSCGCPTTKGLVRLLGKVRRSGAERRPPLSHRAVEARDRSRCRGRLQPLPGAAHEFWKALRHGRNQPSPPVSAGLDGVPARCAPGQAPVWLRPEVNQMRMLVATDGNWKPEDGSLFNACTDGITITNHGNPLPDPRSGWIDFVVFTKPGPDGSGHIVLFANGQPIITVKGHVGHADKGLGENQYFKFGPYRAADTTDWTLYYDDFRRSPRCEDVLTNGSCPFS